MKEILVIYYSQTGQLKTILDNICSEIKNEQVKITYYKIETNPTFEFPWKKDVFYDTFPESFLQISRPIEAPPKEILDKKFDLVILGYQVWYLTPSIPIASFLNSEFATSLLKNTPVITVVACRNMWIKAQEKMKQLLVNNKAKLVGHIALVDQHINHISVITISHWMFSGRKDRYLGVFPKPGVSDTNMAKAARFGEPIKNALSNSNYTNLQDNLLKLKALTVNPFLVQTDERGNVLFSKWANLLIKKGKPGTQPRKKWITLFKFYLLFAIWVIAPIVFIVFLLTYLPMTKKRNRERKYYSSVSLKEN